MSVATVHSLYLWCGQRDVTPRASLAEDVVGCSAKCDLVDCFPQLEHDTGPVAAAKDGAASHNDVGARLCGLVDGRW